MSGLVKAYLVAYNAAAALAWAHLQYVMWSYLASGGTTAGLYALISSELTWVQTSAVLEVVHSAIGIVRSPVATTFIQVLSRLAVLWGIVHVAPPAQVHWAFALMAISWSLVEVPRYVFYLWKLVSNSVPYWLLWVRYSLFIVLYPTGITGEVGCVLNSMEYIKAAKVWTVTMPNAHNLPFSYYLFLFVILAAYVPGSFIMYNHMLSQRKKELAKAKAVEAPAAATADGKSKSA